MIKKLKYILAFYFALKALWRYILHADIYIHHCNVIFCSYAVATRLRWGILHYFKSIEQVKQSEKLNNINDI